MARIPKVCSKNVMSFLSLKDQVKIEYKDKNIELALSDFKPKTSTLSYEHSCISQVCWNDSAIKISNALQQFQAIRNGYVSSAGPLFLIG